jgi:hypothetical protein
VFVLDGEAAAFIDGRSDERHPQGHGGHVAVDTW